MKFCYLNNNVGHSQESRWRWKMKLSHCGPCFWTEWLLSTRISSFFLNFNLFLHSLVSTLACCMAWGLPYPRAKTSAPKPGCPQWRAASFNGRLGNGKSSSRAPLSKWGQLADLGTNTAPLFPKILVYTPNLRRTSGIVSTTPKGVQQPPTPAALTTVLRQIKTQLQVSETSWA